METNICPKCGAAAMEELVDWNETQRWTLNSKGQKIEQLDCDESDGETLYYECSACDHRVEVEK